VKWFHLRAIQERRLNDIHVVLLASLGTSADDQLPDLLGARAIQAKIVRANGRVDPV